MAVQNLREKLILAGIGEINRCGIQNFSVRRVATECGVSCATPYKYFKDRQCFVAGILDYIRSQWRERQKAVLERFQGSVKRQLQEICVEYVRFLVENPYFRSILMLKDEEIDSVYRGGSALGETSRGLIASYCREVNMPAQTEKLKTYVVKSLIYGAALMFDNGELEYDDANMALVSTAIKREFELP